MSVTEDLATIGRRRAALIEAHYLADGEGAAACGGDLEGGHAYLSQHFSPKKKKKKTRSVFKDTDIGWDSDS